MKNSHEFSSFTKGLKVYSADLLDGSLIFFSTKKAVLCKLERPQAQDVFCFCSEKWIDLL